MGQIWVWAKSSAGYYLMHCTGFIPRKSCLVRHDRLCQNNYTLSWVWWTGVNCNMHEDKKPIMQARDCEKVFASSFVQLVQVRRSVFGPNTQLSMSFFLDTNLLCALSTASLFQRCIALNQFNWRMMIQLTGSIHWGSYKWKALNLMLQIWQRIHI